MDLYSSSYPYTSKRSTLFARNGMVATSQPLAAQAGLRILQQGGNAVDSAIATAATLTVVEPCTNGIGGDAFALVWMAKDKKLQGLNASGTCPSNLSLDTLKEKSLTELPTFGWLPVTVPGIPSAWSALSKKYGKLTLLECLQPAIEYARNGYPLTTTLAYYFNRAFIRYKEAQKNDKLDTPFEEWFKVFAPNGSTPKAGEIIVLKDHADTLEEIGRTNGDSFYTGKLAKIIDDFAKKTGGILSKEDLANYKPKWVDPISTNYKGYDICEIPPNGQGLVALSALNILKNKKGFTNGNIRSSSDIHTHIEAMKLAFADGKHYITDQQKMTISNEELLSEEYAKKRALEIEDHAKIHGHGNPKGSGTVYLCTADKDGNMVSYIQSNYMGFGSGIVVPTTGIALQNRGLNFSVDPKHNNFLEPNKRTYHTIIPAFILKDNEPVGPFGIMGGFMQPQAHMQVALNLIDYNLNPQSALDAPRWQWIKDKTIELEKSMPDHIVTDLINRGHDVIIPNNPGSFGRGQIIFRNKETGVLIGATEHRTDGCVACY